MKHLTVCLALVTLVLYPANTAFAAPSPSMVLGQVISEDVTMDGLGVPSGTTLLDETLLETRSHSAAIHLGIGPVLELAESSSAFFERLDSGEVRVSVETGRLSFSEGGETTTVFEAANLTIPNLTGAAVAVDATEASGHEDDEESADQDSGSEGISGTTKAMIVVGSVVGAAMLFVVGTKEESKPASKIYP